MNGQKIKDTILNFIVPLSALGLTVALFFIIIYPGMNNLPLLEEEQISKRNLENQLKTKLATLNKLRDFESVVAENGILVERVLVSEAEVPGLLTQIDIVAGNSGLDVTKLSYSFGEVTEEEALLPYNLVNVSLGALGNYDQINVFLDTLENSARLVDASTFRFAFSNVAETEGMFTATFILTSPFLHVESDAVTDDPVNVDIADPAYIELLDKIKELRFYDVSIDARFEELEESTSEEIEDSIEEEEVPEGEVSLEDLETTP